MTLMIDKGPRPSPIVSLASVRPGQRVRISSLEGGQGIRSRFCAMGLGPGMLLDVVSSNGGPIILNVMGSRVMLGRGIAQKVRVRVLEAASPEN